MAVEVLEKIIKFRNLDYEVKAKLADHIIMTTYSLYNAANINEDDFKAALDSGMREDILAIIREHYSFIDIIKIDISNTDLYTWYKFILN
jgi:hypothetical protein